MQNTLGFSIKSYIFNLVAVGIIVGAILLIALLYLIHNPGEAGIGFAIILVFVVMPVAGVFQMIAAYFALRSKRLITISILAIPALFLLVIFQDLFVEYWEWILALLLLAHAAASGICLAIDVKRNKQIDDKIASP
jgi:hypothetical protein